MGIKNFQDLNVWSKSHNLTVDIYRITNNYPREEIYGLVSQIRRSASSICSNIAEGHKKSTRDYIRYINIAEGSLEETKYHLILSRDLCYLDYNNFKVFFERCEEVGKMLSGLKRKLA